MIVWHAAVGKKIKGRLYILAILLHAVLDGVAVLAAKSGMSLILVETLVWLTAAGVVRIAWNVWKKERKEERLVDSHETVSRKERV